MATKKSPTDVTGRSRDELADQFSDETAKRAEEMSLATATAVIQAETQVIDATKPDRQTVIVDTVNRVGKQDDTVIIRVVENIENMTLGAGNNFSFKPGQKYEVTRSVAEHLKEKGYLAANI
jgi:hypothetical protein